MLNETFHQSDFERKQSRLNAAKLRALCLHYSELGRRAGVKILAHRPGSGARYLTLPLSQQEGILHGLTTSIDICTSAIENNIELDKDNLLTVWWSLQKLGFRPSSDLFDQLKGTDLIEVYNLENIQLFRTFNMFQCLSYSLEELYSYEWWELFERDQAVTDQILSITSAIVSGKCREVVLVKNSPHQITEVFSPDMSKSEIQTRILAPIYTIGNQIGGYISATHLIRTIEPSSVFKTPYGLDKFHLI